MLDTSYPHVDLPEGEYVPLQGGQVPAQYLPPLQIPSTYAKLTNGAVDKTIMPASNIPAGPYAAKTAAGQLSNANTPVLNADNLSATVVLYGPLIVLAGSVVSFNITNYNSKQAYSVSAASGTVSLAGRTITYTAPATAGTDTIIVNGTAVPITITANATDPLVVGPSAIVSGVLAAYYVSNYVSTTTYTTTTPNATTARTPFQEFIQYRSTPGVTGIAPITINGVSFQISLLPAPAPAVDGPLYLSIGEVAMYTISNYVPESQYTVAAINGSVSVSGDQITYTAPSSLLPGVFTINGTAHHVNIVNNYILTPALQSPVNGATGQLDTITFTGTPFQTSTPGPIQQSASWELATDGAFTNIVQSSINDTVNLNSWTVTALAALTTYYVRVYYNAAGMPTSEWSQVVSFTTGTLIPSAIVAAISATDGTSGDYFGVATALSSNGNTLVVGASNKNINGNSAQGAAYIFTKVNGTWTQQTELIAADGGMNNYYGRAVAINAAGTVVAIGAYGKTVNGNSNQGAVYVYSLIAGVWTLQAEITAIDGSTLSTFGNSLSFDSTGTIMAIGSALKTVGANGLQGTVYIYTESAGVWNQTAEIVASNGANSDYFGICVSLNAAGNILAIGAYNKTIGSNAGQGATYVYVETNGAWAQQAELTAIDGVAGDNFGISVQLNGTGTVLVVGAYTKANGANTSQGAAYVFAYSGGSWAQQSKLLSSDGAVNDWFGQAVAINAAGTIIAIGAMGKVFNGHVNFGAAYIFIESAGVWAQHAELVPVNGALNGYFGYSVAFDDSGDTVAVGGAGMYSQTGVGSGTVSIVN